MKKTLAILMLLVAGSVWAGQTSILLSTVDVGGVSQSTTTYIPVSGNGTSTATEANVIQYLPPGTLSNLRCDARVVPNPGTWTMTVRVGAADTSLTCAIGTAATVCFDATHTATVGADPRVTIKIAPAASPTGTNIGCSLFFQRT